MSGCATRRASVPTPTTPALARRFTPVNVREDRVIRTIGGLRPYRPSGFVVKRELIAGKTIIHNYGHGGGGITLSWGTSRLAVDLAPDLPGEVAVIGCGVVGLSTARLLQRRGTRVTIYARETPPDTTSNVAGGQWSPTAVFRTDKATPEFQDQFVQAARIAYRYYQTMVGDYYGIRWIQNFVLANDLGEDQMHGPSSPIHELFPEYAEFPKTPFGMPGRRFTTMLIEPSIYLPALLRDFYIAGGRLVERELKSFDEVPEPMLFNCTGLGAGKLANDPDIRPAKGQLVFLLPQPEIDYIAFGPDILYMFPRRDGILLGGSFEPDNWDPTPDPARTKQILDGHRELFSRLAT